MMKKVLFTILFSLIFVLGYTQNAQFRTVRTDSLNSRAITIRENLKLDNISAGDKVFFLVYDPVTRLVYKMDTTGWGGPGGQMSADNLGNHIMIQNLETNTQWISEDGDNEGILLYSDGDASFSSDVVFGGNMNNINLPDSLTTKFLMISGAGKFYEIDTADIIDFIGGGATNIYNDTLWDIWEGSIFPSDTLYYVGIGTSDPVVKLDVIGAVHISDSLHVDSLPTRLTQYFVLWDPVDGTLTKADTAGLLDITVLGDNLGDHELDSNLVTGAYYISYDGADSGIVLSSSNTVGIWSPPLPAYSLIVGGNSRFGISDADTIWFGDSHKIRTSANGIGLGSAGSDYMYMDDLTAPNTIFTNIFGVGIKTDTMERVLTINGGVFASGASEYEDTVYIYGPTFLQDSVFLTALSAGTDSIMLTIDTTNGQVSYISLSDLVTPGDNLGNHIATQIIVLDSNTISNDGDDEGIKINDDGVVTTTAMIVEDSLVASGLKYPTSDATSGYVIATDGNGVLSFAAPSAPPPMDYAYIAFEDRGEIVSLTYNVWQHASVALRNVWTDVFTEGFVFRNDTLFADSAGYYKIDANLTVGSAAACDIGFRIRSNLYDTYSSGTHIDSLGYAGSIPNNGIIELRDGDYLVPQIINLTDGTDATIISGSIVVTNLW